LIYQRVVSGTGLLVFLDGTASTEFLKIMQTASEGRMAPPFEPGIFLEPESNGGRSWVDIQYGQKPMQVFKQADNRGLEKVKIKRYFQTRPVDFRNARILARYPDGSSALAATSAGSGRVLWANFPVVPDRSNLAASPLLPALIHECLAFFGDGGTDTEGRPGRRWEVVLPRVDGDVRPQVVDSDGRVIASQAISLGDRKKLTIQPPEKTGVYRILDNDRLIAKAVVNIDPRESDPRRINAEDLVETLVKTNSRARVVTDSDGLVKASQNPLWHWAGVGTAIFLLAEMLLLSFWRRPPSGLSH
jgi:hypothetical protein